MSNWYQKLLDGTPLELEGFLQPQACSAGTEAFTSVVLGSPSPSSTFPNRPLPPKGFKGFCPSSGFSGRGLGLGEVPNCCSSCWRRTPTLLGKPPPKSIGIVPKLSGAYGKDSVTTHASPDAPVGSVVSGLLELDLGCWNQISLCT